MIQFYLVMHLRLYVKKRNGHVRLVLVIFLLLAFMYNFLKYYIFLFFSKYKYTLGNF